MINSLKKFTLVVQVCVTLALVSCGLATSAGDRIARASDQIEAGEYRAAMIELKNVLASQPDNAEARLLLAEVSFGLGDVLAAEKELTRAAELNAPESAIRPLHMRILLAKADFTGVLAALGMETTGLSEEQQWSFRGDALLGLGNAETAAATFREWLSVDATSVEAAVGLAKAAAAQGDNESAAESLQKLTQTAPGDFTVWHSLGVARFQSGDFAAAEAAMVEAASVIKPQANILRYAAILAGLTETQLVLGKNEDARRSLNQLMGVSPKSPTTLLLAARLAKSENDYALASRHLQTLLNVSPDNGRAQLFLANMQMMQGNFAQAESLLQRTVAKSPDNLQARKLLAQVQLRQSQPGGAIEALAPLLEGDIEDADLYTILAAANLQQGDMATAIQQFRAASELAPEDMDAKLNLASAYIEAGEVTSAMEVIDQIPEGAVALFRRERLLMAALVASDDRDGADAVADKLLAGNTSQAAASTTVADHYLRTGRVERAKQILHELVVAHPDVIDAKNALARIEFSDGNNDRAEALFSSVVESDENNLIALVGLARIADRAGDSEKKVQLLTQAAREHPQGLAPRVLLVREYMKLGDTNAAERSANELVTIGFHNATVSALVASVFAEVGRTEESLAHYQRAAKLDPLSSRIQIGLARVFLALDRSVDARQALNKALEITPDWTPAFSLLVLIEIRQGQFNDAQRSVAEFRQRHPDDVTGMVLEGEVLFYQREYELAAQAFRRAGSSGAGRSAMLREYQASVGGALPNPAATLERWLAENSEDTLVRGYLAHHLQQNGRSDDAVREYERILQVEPDNVIVLNNLAWEYQQQGDLKRAEELAEKAYALDSESGSILDTLGWIRHDLGQLEKSVELLSDAARLSPDNGEIQFHYAVALSDSGDKDEARQILERLKNSNVQFRSRKRVDELLGQL